MPRARHAAYFDATRSAVATVRHAVSFGDVWEEEDFVLHVAGFDVGAAAVGDDAAKPNAALARLALAETWLVENAGAEDRRGALLARVRFRIAMHEAYEALFGLADPKRAVAAAADARASLRRAAAHLAKARATTEETEDETGDETGWDPNRLGFDRKLNLSKMGPSPPRAVRLMSVQKGFAYFSDLIHELTLVCDVAPLVASRAGSLHDALAFLNAFRHERRKKGADPCIVSRSFAAIAVLHPSRGGVLGKHPGDAALRSAWLLGAAPPPRLRLEADPAGGLGGAEEPAGGRGDGPKGPTKGPTRTCLLVSWAASRPEPRSSTVAVVPTRLSRKRKRTPRARRARPSSARSWPRRRWAWSSWCARTCATARGAAASCGACSGSGARWWTRPSPWTHPGSSPGTCGDSASAARGVRRAASAPRSPRARSPRARGRRAFEVWSGAVLVRAMLAHLTLGFELELYLPHELSMVYWYQEYLTEVLQGKLRVAERGLAAHLDAAAEAEASARAAANPKPRTGKKDAFHEDEFHVTNVTNEILAETRTEGNVLEAHNLMCKGMLRFTAGLSASDRSWRPSRGDFTDAEQTFWQRFGIFHAVRDPAPLVYQDFEQYVRLGDGVTADRLFELAAECFTGARARCKKLLELPAGALSRARAEDLAGLDKTAAANAAAARLAMAAPAMRAEFAFAAHHPTFPTVKLVRGG